MAPAKNDHACRAFISANAPWQRVNPAEFGRRNAIMSDQLAGSVLDTVLNARTHTVGMITRRRFSILLLPDT